MGRKSTKINLKLNTLKQVEKAYNATKYGITDRRFTKVQRLEREYKRNSTQENLESYKKAMKNAITTSTDYSKYATKAERQQLYADFGRLRRAAQGKFENARSILEESQSVVGRGMQNISKLAVRLPHEINYKVKNKLQFLTNDQIREQIEILKVYNKDYRGSQSKVAMQIIKDLIRIFIESLKNGNYSVDKAVNWEENLIAIYQNLSGLSYDEAVLDFTIEFESLTGSKGAEQFLELNNFVY